tara:strand:+ start:1551 stop:1727 length:177 start_codon:yes stop_codon:yes gene_type:complete
MPMSVKKWLRQYAVALPVLTGIISLGIFAITRAWNFHRNQYCALCNDLPEQKNDNQPR